MADRYVSTKAIRAALKGRETDVLDALKVGWRAGRPHIRCPYPDHDDGNASWRWDARKGRAFCTCIEGSHSVFDVLIKCELIGFEEAKVRAAELVSRPDLIRTKGDTLPNGSERIQATDAGSLLHPPTDNRDDTLPIAYLAFRLGCDPQHVPRPVTPITGITRLAYFDPPPQGQRGKGKPKLVGYHPCAVFGMVDPDGKTHAHRIYVAPDGGGKAQLGNGPNNLPRDPKKSARVAQGDNIAGRCVLWGDPANAPHLMVFEGIETAAAAALAFAPEIAAGSLTVAAAVSAAGITGLKPWPATKRITIGADRDEGTKATGKPGSRRGETAARRFALHHRETITILIGLPGCAGESLDWLDVLLRDGVERVRDGLTAAALFVPTPAEIDDLARSLDRAAELAEVEAAYPLPVLNSLRLAYRHTRSGEVWVHRHSGKDQAVDDWEPIVTPFGVPARLRQADQADSYGLRVMVRDMAGKARAVDFERAQLARMQGSEIRAMFMACGLRAEQDGESVAVAALKAANPPREILMLRRPGWHELDGIPDIVFITPAGAVIGAPVGIDMELANSVCMAPGVATGGTLAGWRMAIDAAISVSGCPHWTLGIVAAFVGPLVGLTGLDTCGVNLSGMSTSGKSTAQRLAVSAWSTPDIRKPGLFQSMRTTENAAEALAQRATGTVLSLDEMAHVSGQAVGRMIYSIAGGVGKTRLDANAAVRGSYAWSTFAVLSGECSLEEKIKTDGGQWTAGMAVRIVDIDVTGINRAVDPSTLAAISAIENHYGTAGPAFVHALVASGAHRQPTVLRDRVMQAARKITGDETDSAAIRAALPFALLLIAGELARQFRLLPATAPIADAVRWAWERFQQSADSMALHPEDQAIGNIRAWIAERWAVTIKPTDTESGINNREAVGWYDQASIYIPANRIREASGNLLKETHLGMMLDARGLLTQRRAPRFTVQWVPKVGRVQSYALRRSEFGRAEQPSNFTLYRGDGYADRD